jgi:hypothetical protein
MQNNANENPASADSLQRKHEARDPHLRNALIVVASVAFMVIFCLAGAGILIAFFSRQRPMQSTQTLGVIAAPDLTLLTRFPAPNLQIDDGHAQMTALISNQNQKLNTYGWVDRSNGIVRIPIEHAMDLILARGLPTRTNGISQTANSSLQLIQERPQAR